MKGPVRLRWWAALSSSGWARRHLGGIFARVLAVLAAALVSQDSVFKSMVGMTFFPWERPVVVVWIGSYVI